VVKICFAKISGADHDEVVYLTGRSVEARTTTAPRKEAAVQRGH
jgi:hypothetical protein